MDTRHDRSECELCLHAAEHGWWGVAYTHCAWCGRSWSGLNEGHCMSCHRHFSSPGTFDKHRKGGACLSDRSMVRRGLRLVDSKWGPIWKGRKRVM